MLYLYIVLGVYLSGYHVVPKALSKEEILQSTKSCHAIIFDSIISMDILITMSGAGLEVIVPSQCSSKYIVLSFHQTVFLIYW